MRKRRLGNFILLLLLALLLGAAAGGFLLLFLKLMKLGVAFFWQVLPALGASMVGAVPYYAIVLCALGGIWVGLCQKYIGAYPEPMEAVMATVKQTGQYGSKKVVGVSVSALLPIVFGGSVGPEAGLVGIISSLCTWVGNRLRRARGKLEKLAAEEAALLSRKLKWPLYMAAVLSGIGVYLGLNALLGGGLHIERFASAHFGATEALWFVPLALFGIAAGYYYFLCEKLAALAFSPLERFKILRGVAGGLLLGVCGTFFPYTMFSGELQIALIMESWADTPMIELFLIGFLKIAITNVCVQSGWRGGHIFPVLFSGVCLGYAMVYLIGVDSVFAVVVTVAAFSSVVLRKAVVAVPILLLFLPVNSIPYMVVAAIIGARVPIPKLLLMRAEE